MSDKKLHFETCCEPGKYSQNWSAWRCAPKPGECFKSEVNLVFHFRKFYLTNLHWKQQFRQLEYKCTYTHVLLLNRYYDLQILTAMWSLFITTVLQLVPHKYWNVRCCIMSLCQMTIPSCIKTKWTPQVHVYKILQLLWVVILGQHLGREEKEALRETPKACRSGKMEVYASSPLI